jgi:hypothetical protein
MERWTEVGCAVRRFRLGWLKAGKGKGGEAKPPSSRRQQLKVGHQTFLLITPYVLMATISTSGQGLLISDPRLAGFLLC